MIIPKNHCTFSGCRRLSSSLLLLYHFEFSFILFFPSIPLLPVVEDAVEHGLDLWVEARELLHRKGSETTEHFEKIQTNQRKWNSFDKWVCSNFGFPINILLVTLFFSDPLCIISQRIVKLTCPKNTILMNDFGILSGKKRKLPCRQTCRRSQ